MQIVYFGIYFTDWVVKAFLWDVFLKLHVCIRCKLQWEVPFKLIFILINMEPLGFLVFFLTLRAQGMTGWWRRRWTRRSSPLLLFTLLLTCLLSLSRWRMRLGRRYVQHHFLVFCFLRDLPLFGLKSHWITLCSIFQPWEPSSSFSLSLLSRCTFLKLTSAIFLPPVCKSAKVEREGWGSGLHFYIAMTLREYNIWLKQRFYKKLIACKIIPNQLKNLCSIECSHPDIK